MIPLLSLLLAAQAAEGMWLPEQAPDVASLLAEAGVSLSPQALADPKGAPLGSIVSLGWCSASFISPDGLIATNHHCVESYLQYNATAAQNLDQTGYLAASRDKELWAGPAARLYVVDAIEDVTQAMGKGINARTADAARLDKIDRNRKKLVADCEAEPNRRCRVVAYYGGQEWRLIRQRVFKDVRLVYAPPSSVGSYGGDIDNWMWPRHAGDFALIRAYVSPSGDAAAHDAANVPYKPPQHLRIDPTGASPGEAALVAGYPGGTSRYERAASMRFSKEVTTPASLRLLQEELIELKSESMRDPEAAARLGAPIDYLSNSLKYLQGLEEGYARTPALARKESEEAALRAWVMADPARKSRYAAALVELDQLEERERARWLAETHANHLLRNADLLSVAYTAFRFAIEREKPDLERRAGYQQRDLEDTTARFATLDKTLWLPADRATLAVVMRAMVAAPPTSRVEPVVRWIEKQGGVNPALDRLFAATALTEQAARAKLLSSDRAAIVASKDPWVELAIALHSWMAPVEEDDDRVRGGRYRLEPVYMAALAEFRGRAVYPDANGTLRFTFGRVTGMSPRDGVQYAPQTTLTGLVAKAGAAPFDAPPKLLAAAAAGPKSRWADPALGTVPVDFLTDLDTTGGNSGSATLNGKGELIGLIFDGNYESMTGDWIYDPATTRSIHVDIRYLLWMLDEVEGAKGLLEELGVKP